MENRGSRVHYRPSLTLYDLVFSIPPRRNTGSIPLKRLLKIYNIKKKTAPERKNKLLEVIKELCTSKKDQMEGSVLVLKPHYSKKM